MDFTNRSNQSGAPNVNRPVEGVGSVGHDHMGHEQKRMHKMTGSTGLRVTQLILTFCIVVVLAGLTVFLVFNKGTNERKFVDNNNLQAIFLNTGQVYFGNIKTLNTNFLVVNNIFYLQANSSSTGTGTTASTSPSNTSVSLVKLGCELHAPLDQMVINRTSVTFWENLSPTGQVAKAVATWQKDNPNGQKCSDQSTAGTSGQSTPQAATNNTGTSTTTNTGTTSNSTPTGASH